MAKHHHQPRSESLGSKFDTADPGRRDDVAGDADHKKIAQALIENNLRWHARISAAENDRKRRLPLRQFLSPLLAGQRVSTLIGNKSAIPLDQTL